MPSSPQLFHVFVYGTLKPGERYFDRYCADTVVAMQEAIIYGQLYDLPLGYPALTLGNRLVYGMRLSFAEPSVLAALDELEDYSPHRPLHANEYYRIQRPIFSLTCQPLGIAWVYMMEPSKIAQIGGILLPEGRWTGHWKTDTMTTQES